MAKDKLGQTCLHLAATGAAGANMMIDCFSMLLDDGGFDLCSQEDSEGKTALHLCVMHGFMQRFEKILEKIRTAEEAEDFVLAKDHEVRV